MGQLVGSTTFSTKMALDPDRSQSSHDGYPDDLSFHIVYILNAYRGSKLYKTPYETAESSPPFLHVPQD